MPSLRPYQEEDVLKLSSFPTMGCFNEQRTGKTPTAITTLDRLGVDKIVIICPASAIYQWTNEYTRWTNGKKATALVGTRQRKQKLLDEWETGAVVISYDAVRDTINSKGFADFILEKNPQAVIADEAHRFKNPKSKTFLAVKKLIAVPRRLALTGTPAHGKPEEIYSILYWLYPNDFKSYWKFTSEFFYTFRRSVRGQTFMEVGSFKAGKERELQTYLKGMSTQRKRKEVMPWLPEKDITSIRLPLTTQQTKQLNELEKYFETGDVVTQGILDRLMRYRQVCLAPELLGLSGDSPKTQWILDYLEDYPETPTIIFSKFTSYIKLLEKELVKENKRSRCGVIIGETPLQKRAEFVTAFQHGELDLLLINIDAGKEALTLDRAEVIVFTDVYPPAADIQQAEDRFVSTTEDKADKPHRIYRLMMADSYDEQVYSLVDKRASITDLLNDYKKYLKGE